MAETAPPTQPTPTPPAAPGAPPPGAGPRFGAGVHVGGADWPAQAADAVVRVVGQVRDRTVAPAYTIARGLVYGLLAAILATMALVLVLVALVRFIDVYLPGDVWSAYLLLGAVLTIGGFVLWSQRRPTPTD